MAGSRSEKKDQEFFEAGHFWGGHQGRIAKKTDLFFTNSLQEYEDLQNYGMP
jgi:hypothetical protein